MNLTIFRDKNKIAKIEGISENFEIFLVNSMLQSNNINFAQNSNFQSSARSSKVRGKSEENLKE